MNTLCSIVLFGWPVVVAALFRIMAPRRAVIVAYLGAVLFLPCYHIKIPWMVDYGKNASNSVGMILGMLLFDQDSLLRFRPRWADVPMLAWCLCPIASSILNDLGFPDGISESQGVWMTYGIPYLMGRIYLSDAKGLKEVATALVVGGLIYVPFCLFEVRMSPVLHKMIYGFTQQSWDETVRMGGWRPVVFMDHGLAVSLFLALSTLSAFTLWLTGAVERLGNRPMALWAALLGGVTILCHSTGAVILLLAGIATVLGCRWGRRAICLVLLLAIPPLYIAARASGAWSGTDMVQEIAAVDAERAGSLDYRLRAEDTLVQHALRQPVFGWGGWARNRPTTFDSEAPAYATDGLWIIVMGKYGFVGLGGVLGALLLPGFLLALKLPRSGWKHPATAPAIILAVVLGVYMVDCLMNAMPNPLYLLGAGSLMGVMSTSDLRRARAPSSPTPESGPSQLASPGVAG